MTYLVNSDIEILNNRQNWYNLKPNWYNLNSALVNAFCEIWSAINLLSIYKATKRILLHSALRGKNVYSIF